ncbi:hypothetical protein [Brevibacillus sp. MER 51]|uniref:hypothetical protein n=1 Tax=Brevibacillus sp. MER 51 TaxID=2939560 RepID=UPI00203CD2C7|nr:hypothetical protein [Brevibacillus sp. MER 51]MCM3141321.1 hypothetical protein [Brevibacillus sp. MER 51]
MSEETKPKRKWPTTKDFIYLQIFSVILIVFLLVNGIPNPEVLSEKLVLGAALFSILLAGVAIIIPFIQSNETSRQSFQMLSEVSKLTSEFSKLTSDIAILKEIRADVSQDIEGVISKVLDVPQPDQNPQSLEQLKKQNEEFVQAMNELKEHVSNLNKQNIINEDMEPFKFKGVTPSKNYFLNHKTGAGKTHFLFLHDKDKEE